MSKNRKKYFSGFFTSSTGFTLVEILIVLSIMASMMAFAVTFIGSSPTSQMKTEAGRLIRIIRYSYRQAATTSQYYRLEFNLDDQQYKVEVSGSPFYVVREGDAVEELRKKREEENRDRSLDISAEDGEVSAPETSAADGNFAESEDELLEIFQIPENIRITDVYVMHQKEPVTEGKAYLYFFPNGQTEFAVLHLGDPEDEDKAYTLIVNPLTGLTELREGYVEQEDVLGEMGEDS